MPWCPDCHTEYDPGITRCADCGADLVQNDPASLAGPAPVLVYEAGTASEAQVVEATLESEGIPAFVQPTSMAFPGESIVHDSSPDLDVYVPADLAHEAEDVLREPPISEEELAEMAES